ncbi:unnamed protein product [Staurois parvus]|uniref:ubiquitinyl hydrolase 1 n=1 Tax=Staurois parvus TaxID=386267 RepID=A0ABN9FP33_9NEOB|nr:unnamed protein product [Staurois parvus]
MELERDTDDFLMYFILMEKVPVGNRTMEPGKLCYMSEESYLQRVTGDQNPTQSLNVHFLEESALVEVDVNVLQPLKRRQAALLLAITNPTERLSCFLERGLLDQAVKAEVGQRVLVEHEQKLYPAFIHYVGNILDSSALLPPIYFGVELEGEGEGCGKIDGTFRGVTFFKCKQNSGLLLPFNKILFSGAAPSDILGSPLAQTPVNQGDKVSYFVDDELKRGLVIFNKMADGYVEVLPEDSSSSTLMKIPLDAIVKEDITPDGAAMCREQKSPNDGKQKEELLGRNLEVDSLVQIQYQEGEMAYGIIRWLGYLPQMEDAMVGVELEEDKGCTDGSWQGRRYFFCGPKRGIFVKLKACQPDTRFLSSKDCEPKSLEVEAHNKEGYRIPGKVPPLQGCSAVDILQGDMKGIQGHCNSCYMDAALFSLFSCSSSLDALLFKPASHPDREIQRTLREEIVNPLRKNGYVSADSVMMLRHQLMQESQCPSFTTSEKEGREVVGFTLAVTLSWQFAPLLMLCSLPQVKGSRCPGVLLLPNLHREAAGDDRSQCPTAFGAILSPLQPQAGRGSIMFHHPDAAVREGVQDVQ